MAQKIKNASTSDTMAEALANVNNKKVNEWKRFLEIADEQKKTRYKDKGKQIWVDTETLKTLDMMKLAGIGYPVRYMLNAAVKVFLESNADNVDEWRAKLKL